jgi:hypothetical protein
VTGAGGAEHTVSTLNPAGEERPARAPRLRDHLVTLRRFLVLAALFFWQGGFTFYTAVVVPVGTEVLHGARRQGFITRQVTRYLNWTGTLALVPLAWDVAGGSDRSAWRRRLRALCWLGLLLAQAALFPLHAYLDSLLQPRGGIVLDLEAFHPAHRLYLWVSTFQWGCGVAFLLLTLLAWRAEDRHCPALA